METEKSPATGREPPEGHARIETDSLPNRTTVFILRGVSLGAAYVFWYLARWLYEADPVSPPLGLCLLVLAATACALFLLLGAVVPDSTLHRIWKAIGKVLVFLLTIS